MSVLFFLITELINKKYLKYLKISIAHLAKTEMNKIHPTKTNEGSKNRSMQNVFFVDILR